MLGAMSGPAAGFNASKSMAIWGCGMALIVWFGIFTVIGGAALPDVANGPWTRFPSSMRIIT
ncbi:MAG: DUF2165 family protein [Parvularculaceae bacterium]